jgi:hypothetical protein
MIEKSLGFNFALTQHHRHFQNFKRINVTVILAWTEAHPSLLPPELYVLQDKDLNAKAVFIRQQSTERMFLQNQGF